MIYLHRTCQITGNSLINQFLMATVNRSNDRFPAKHTLDNIHGQSFPFTTGKNHIGNADKADTAMGLALDAPVKSAIAKLKDFGVTEGAEGITIGEFPFKEVEGKTLGELGYDAAKAEAICKLAVAAIKDPSLKSLAHAIDKAYDASIKAYKAAGDDEAKQKAAAAKKKVCGQANAVVKFGSNMLRKIAFAGYTCCKAAKAPAKAEGEAEQK